MNPVTSPRADRQLLEFVSALRQPILMRCLLLLTVTYVAIISLPQPWVPYGTGLDASWILGLNLAHGQGMVAGRDIVYPDPVCAGATITFDPALNGQTITLDTRSPNNHITIQDVTIQGPRPGLLTVRGSGNRRGSWR